jgi:tRNA-splicing ligase RtcB (3'-phosphate/5'-hydroxy nucleic acid ligase)
MWLDEIEDGALEQAKNLANLPFAFNHIAIMPDSHVGYGMPIGGVLATTDVIVPNAVGVDIGCGMCAVRTSLTDITKESLKKIMGEIRKAVPVGFSHHKAKQDEKLMPQMDKGIICEQQYHAALEQIGTLGGGNHFIEIQKGSDGHIWIMIHSGSRNFGLQTAKYHNDIAIGLNEKWHTPVPKQWELAYLPLDSKEGQEYVKDMNYCVEFALANRKLMMDRIIQIFADLSENGIDFCAMINIAHNYAALEHHLGKNVMVHRKGATLAREGITGIIPGSQGTKSYIVHGKGNKMSFQSCSHGAGRRLGRKEAERTLDLAAEIKLLDDQGIIHAIRGKQDLDEATGAYKPIDVVMNNQKDLVDIVVELTPLAVIKG